MRRRIFNILAAISLVLCLATAGLWVASYSGQDWLSYRRAGPPNAGDQRDSFCSEAGILSYHHDLYSAVRSPAAATQESQEPWFDRGFYPYRYSLSPWDPLDDAKTLGHEFMGFGYLCYTTGVAPAGSGGPTPYTFAIFFPHWFVILLFAAAPLHWTVGKLRQRRARLRHLCKNCGYDLRATPDADGPLLARCPECGSVEAQSK